MTQIYHPYWLWEDYQNGMYELNIENSEEKIYLAKHLLSHLSEFADTALRVIEEWTISSETNLTNISCNRQAWIGQASCCYKYKVPETFTRIAWKQLTDQERIDANKVADLCIKNFENTLKNGKKGVTTMAYQMKFQFD
jgi:hypothetical protein